LNLDVTSRVSDFSVTFAVTSMRFIPSLNSLIFNPYPFSLDKLFHKAGFFTKRALWHLSLGLG
jgi:hypothetical protein